MTPAQLLGPPWKVWGITVQTSYWEGRWHQNCGYTSPILFFAGGHSENGTFSYQGNASVNSSGMCMCALVLFIYHTWRLMEKCMWNTRWVNYCHSAFMTNDHGPAFLKRLREVYKNYHSSLVLATALSQNGWIAEKQRRKVNEKCIFETPHSESKKQF